MRHQTARFRDDRGNPVSCLIYSEMGPDGYPEILNSVEISSSSGNTILSQSCNRRDEREILNLYRVWRLRKENQNKIKRVKIVKNRIY